MNKKLLLISITYDVHADRIEQHAQKNIDVIRLNLDAPHDWEFCYLNGEVLISSKGKIFSAKEVASVFVRRTPNIEKYKVSTPVKYSEFSDYFAMQKFSVFSDCLAILDNIKPFVNPLSSNTRLGKLVQASVANDIGLLTPDTYVGSSPNDAMHFMRKIWAEGGRTCMKPVLNTPVNIDNEPHAAFTKIIDQESIDDVESMKYCPVILQRYTNKAYELRVSVIGDRVFAARIDSQIAGGETAIDWRKYNIPKTPHSPITLPTEINNKLLEFHDRTNLIYSSFDLIYTPDGEYVFLETNPYGQWLWIEDLTGLPISQSISDFLCKI